VVEDFTPNTVGAASDKPEDLLEELRCLLLRKFFH
jgi:hypothetical protein